MSSVRVSVFTKVQGPYSVHPGVAQTQKWVDELSQKTGRSLAEWIALTKASGPAMEKVCGVFAVVVAIIGEGYELIAPWIGELPEGVGNILHRSPGT